MKITIHDFQLQSRYTNPKYIQRLNFKNSLRNFKFSTLNINYRKLVFFLFFVLLLALDMKPIYAQSINITGTIKGFRHNWDCGNDGVDGFITGNNNPEPRYKVWVGYNGANFQQSTNNPGLICGASNYTYGANGQSCSTWNPGDIALPTLTGNATTYNVDMESWEEDEYGTPLCGNDNCNKGTCFWNDDDTRCGRLRIGDISLCNYAPCADNTFTGQFTSGTFLSMHNRCGDNNGAGYGINQLVLNWSFNEAPTVTLQPTDPSLGGATRSTCENIELSLEATSNAKCNWTLARWVRWEVSTNGTTWAAIAGSDNATAYTTQTTFNFSPTLPNASPGTPLTRYYRIVMVSSCNKPTTDAGWRSSSLSTISSALTVTIYDPTDAYCTAPQCSIMYVDPVNGNDVNSGSPVSPKKTISNAATPTTTYIRVAKCVSGCTDAGVVNIPNNCVIEGGYVRAGGSGEIWTKSSLDANRTFITFSGQENAPGSNNSIRHIVAFKSDAKSGWVVKDMNITTANTPASTYAIDGRGMSNYGFLIINASSNYTLSRLNLSTGNAGNGSNGSTPGIGGGGSGGSGGSGGAQLNGCGNGNTGGTSSAGSGGVNYGAGAVVNGAAKAGPGPSNVGDGCCSYTRYGTVGNNGNNGGTGASWPNSPAVPIPGISSTPYYLPAGQAESGTDGGGGSGGSGGGGSRGGKHTIACGNCDGRAGGNGGKGGDGGRGGTGGFGAGGTFGIWIKTSNTGRVVQEVNIVSIGNAGVGGIGAAGSAANNSNQNSGKTNGGTNGVCYRENKGGNGGLGGAGGSGGKGRDGANGTSAFFVVDNTTPSLSVAVTNPTNVTIDFATLRNNVTGRACINSQIDLSAATVGVGWSLPITLNYLDNTSFGPSFTAANSSISVTTNSSGLYNLGINSGTLQNFLYVVPDSRTLPVINPTTIDIVCLGSSQTFTVANSYDVSNISQREWTLYRRSGANGQTLTTVITGTSSGFTYTYNTLDSFVLRYRERHNCCGWSRPVFQKFKVIDAPNAPTALSIDGAKCYTGAAQSFTITTTGTIKYSGYDRWYLYDQDPAFGTPTPIANNTTGVFTVSPTISTIYWVRGENQCDKSTTLSDTAVITGSPDANGVLATVNSSFTCKVSGSDWHYFRNSSNEIIAAINSNGEDLDDVTMTVTINTVPHDVSYYSTAHPYGGIGREQTCLGQPELSMKRWYTIIPRYQPSAGHPSTIRLFFTNSEYTQYKSEIGAWTSYTASNYAPCYGYTLDETDLAVSKNDIADIAITSATASLGPNNSTQYEISVPSFSTFRFHTKGGIGEPLPVELVSFTGYNDKEKNVLNWTTATERNADRFEVEKSTAETNEWQYIGYQKAVGNNSSQKDYTFYDNTPLIGDNFYRLKMIDNDGTFKYSNTINIPIAEAEVNTFVKIFPNPTGGKVTVQIQSTKSANTEIKVTNLLGQVVTTNNTALVKGFNQINIDLSSISAGTYLISFIDALGTKHVEKLIKE